MSQIPIRREGGTLVVAVLERPSIESFEIKGNKDIKTEDLQKSLRNVGLATGKMPEAVNRAGIVRDRATSGVLRGYLSEGDRTTIAMARQETMSLLGQIERQLDSIDDNSAKVLAQTSSNCAENGCGENRSGCSRGYPNIRAH